MKQCPTCAARKQNTPEELADLLWWLSPPPSLLSYLDAIAADQGMSKEAAEWRQKWADIHGPGEAVTDKFDIEY